MLLMFIMILVKGALDMAKSTCFYIQIS